MKISRKNFALFLLLVLSGLAAAFGQITPLGDAYTESATPTKNNGSATTLVVDGAKDITYIQFNLASIPAGATVSQATLKLYADSVTTGGSFNVDYVTSAWAENTIDFSNAPPLGAAIASNVNVTSADKNQFILINVTSALQAWLNGSEVNNGLALVANGSFDATFDSKESTKTSHGPELDVVFEGSGGGTITGVLTASGSGLTGGGTSGTLNLSLIESCSSGQTLEWNGSAWGCASLSGGGTITGVTAGTDLTGGGTSGNVTLSLDITRVPQLATANTFTGNQTVNGNVSATGVVIGSAFQIGSYLFGFGNANSFNAFLGFGGNSTMTGTYNTAAGVEALLSDTTGYYNTAAGAQALFSNTTGYANTAAGATALNSNTTGLYNTGIGAIALAANTTGSANTGIGAAALQYNTTGNDNTATGESALALNTAGNFNTADGVGALFLNTTGGNNTAVGFNALQSNQTSTDNTAVGYNALLYSVGSSGAGYNTAVGSQALTANTTGFANTASGYLALSANTTGVGNTASGYYSLVENSTGSGNTAIGDITLETNTTGLANTALGSNAGSTADFSNITGSNNTFLGYNTGPSTGTLTNATAIGALSQVWQSNTLVLGATNGVNGATSDTRVGIADNTPTNLLTLGQGHGKALADGWTTYSSRRWKTNIQTLPDALAKVEKLRGVSYDLKENGQHEIGVIAEEVGAIVPEVVTFEDNGKDARGVDYSRLTALLIEAVKTQQKQIAHQRNAITVLRAQLKQRAAKDAALETRLAKLEKGSDKSRTQLVSARIAPAVPQR
ncbi:MAG: DNRLRE domain-containing protein [Terriglobales bacterium]